MQLVKRKHFNNQYRCQLTAELDQLSGLAASDVYDRYHHYVLVDDLSLTERCFSIRIPGSTVGGLWVDSNNVITKIVIAEYTGNMYPDNINELIQKFVGESIEMPKS